MGARPWAGPLGAERLLYGVAVPQPQDDVCGKPERATRSLSN